MTINNYKMISKKPTNNSTVKNLTQAQINNDNTSAKLLKSNYQPIVIILVIAIVCIMVGVVIWFVKKKRNHVRFNRLPARQVRFAQPIRLQQQALSAQPIRLQQPALSPQPIRLQQPALSVQPIRLQQPALSAQPIRLQQPVHSRLQTVNSPPQPVPISFRSIKPNLSSFKPKSVSVPVRFPQPADITPKRANMLPQRTDIQPQPADMPLQVATIQATTPTGIRFQPLRSARLNKKTF